MTKRTWTRTSGISARWLATLSEINLVESKRPSRGRVRDGLLKSAIRHILGFVAALALGLGTAVTAQAQCAAYPCFRVYLTTTDGGGFDQYSMISPFSPPALPGQDAKGNTELAQGTAQFGSVGSSTSVDVVACPTNCDVAPTAQAGADYIDIFDLRDQTTQFPPGGILTGDMFQFTLSLNGNAVIVADLNNGVIGEGGTAQVIATVTLENGSNLVQDGLFGDNVLPPLNSLALPPITVDPSVDPFLYLDVSLFTFTSIGPVSLLLGAAGSGFTDYLTTFEVTNIALLDANGNFLRNVVLTDLAGFTLPAGPGPGPGTAPEPATLLLVAIALALLGTLSRRTRAN
ncbi:MAG TPA: PEP-CTERM sorting domain-containing protein [Casimicrobiaceae bacterium]